jgi:hypothetical protein
MSPASSNSRNPPHSNNVVVIPVKRVNHYIVARNSSIAAIIWSARLAASLRYRPSVSRFAIARFCSADSAKLGLRSPVHLPRAL